MDRRDFLKLSALAIGAPAALATAKPIISTAQVEVLHRDRYVPIGGLENVRPGDVFRMLYDGKLLDVGAPYEVCLALAAPKLIDIVGGRTWSVDALGMPELSKELRALPWEPFGVEKVYIGTPQRSTRPDPWGRGWLQVYLYHPDFDAHRGDALHKCHLWQLQKSASDMVATWLHDAFPSMGWSPQRVHRGEPGGVCCVTTNWYEDLGEHGPRREGLPLCQSAPHSPVRWRVFGGGLDISMYVDPGVYVGEIVIPQGAVV